VAHECRHDGLPCFGLSACYVHLKAQALNGGWDKLTAEERAFVGVLARSEKRATDGWVSPITNLIDQLGAQVSPENVAILEQMMGVPQDRLEFLG
jgi:hypothetical protein